VAFFVEVSLQVNPLPAWVQRPMHANSLSFKLTHLILMVDVICRSTGVLQHELVSLLHNGPGKGLNTCRVRRLSLRIRRWLPSGLPRLGWAWCPLPGLIWRLRRWGLGIGRGLRLRGRLLCVRTCLLCVEQATPRNGACEHRERDKARKKAEPYFHKNPP